SEHPMQCFYERKKLYHRPSFTEWPKNLKEASNENEPIYIPNNKDKLKSLDITKEQQGVTLFQ
ncbi:2614_t:CDS:2, partial [Racocetra persica]